MRSGWRLQQIGNALPTQPCFSSSEMTSFHILLLDFRSEAFPMMYIPSRARDRATVEMFNQFQVVNRESTAVCAPLIRFDD